MNHGKPFVFLSEALVTVNSPLKQIRKAAQDAHVPWPGDDLVRAVWSNAAWSIRSQARLYQQTDISGKKSKYEHWLREVCSEVMASMEVSSKKRNTFIQDLVKGLSTPVNYTCPQDTRNFITLLEKRAVGWGVIANEGPYYQAILKYLGLKPSILIDAQPRTFKPLPSVIARALKRVPVASKGDVWFVGSTDRPYDNFVGNSALRTILLAPHSDISQIPRDKALKSYHFRIRSLNELEELLGLTWNSFHGLNETLDIPVNDEDDPDSEKDSSKLTTAKLSRNPLLPLGKKDAAAVDMDDMK